MKISKTNGEFPRQRDFIRYLGQLAEQINGDPDGDARILNTWCEICVDSDQWRKLKTSIRKRRYQSKDHEDVQSTLSMEAHRALLELKSRSQAKTISAAIIWANEQLRKPRRS
ncbi:MAG: hypothetical protein CSH37_08020 [Thalassolituus sp.]|nr:MAG: hypothetical protein CSH37_08020 [Thalassolituus sp.]